MRRFYNFKENIGEIGSFALPIFIEQFCIASTAVVSALLVSHIGSAAIAGVSLVEALNLLIQQVFLSLEIGATVVVAQFCGRKDPKSAGEASIQAMLTSMAIALFICILCLCFPNMVLQIVFGQADEAVYAAGRVYFMFTALSFPFLSVYAISIGSIRGSGNPRRSLIGVILVNASFILLGLLFVRGIGLGVAGAGLALLLSRILGAGTGLFLLKKEKNTIIIQRWIPKKIVWPIQKLILLIGIPSCIENMIFTAGRLVTQTYLVPFGTGAIAANALLNSISGFYNIPGSTAVSMAIPLVGKYLGMRDRQRAIDISRIILFIVIGIMVVVSGFFLLFIRPISGLFSDEIAIIEQMLPVGRLYFYLAPAMWPLSFLLPAVLRASGDVKYTTAVSVTSMILFRMTIGYVLCVVLQMGVMGVWIGMACDWGVRGILFGIRYLKGKWADRQLIRDC